MIKIENYMGVIQISENYFSQLIGHEVSSCFGVAGMANSNAKQNLRSRLFTKRDYLDQGIIVRANGAGVDVDLHIVVTYGLNISAIVQSIMNKVRYTVGQATGLEVKNVNVFVDSMKS